MTKLSKPLEIPSTLELIKRELESSQITFHEAAVLLLKYGFTNSVDAPRTRKILETNRRDLLFTNAGGCTVVSDRATLENGDYKTIAHIYDNNTVKYFTQNISEADRKIIEA